MWQCGKCNKAMWTNSGIHRTIRTRSGHYRVAGLCLTCAATHDARDRRQSWQTTFGMMGLAALAGFLCYSFFLGI